MLPLGHKFDSLNHSNIFSASPSNRRKKKTLLRTVKCDFRKRNVTEVCVGKEKWIEAE